MLIEYESKLTLIYLIGYFLVAVKEIEIQVVILEMFS